MSNPYSFDIKSLPIQGKFCRWLFQSKGKKDGGKKGQKKRNEQGLHALEKGGREGRKLQVRKSKQHYSGWGTCLACMQPIQVWSLVPEMVPKYSKELSLNTEHGINPDHHQMWAPHQLNNNIISGSSRRNTLHSITIITVT